MASCQSLICAEFRSQLSTLEDLVAHVPNCIIRELVQDSIAVARNEHQELKLDFDAKLNELDAQKVCFSVIKLNIMS